MRQVNRTPKEKLASKMMKDSMIYDDEYLNIYEEILHIRKENPITFFKYVVEYYGSVDNLKDKLSKMEEKGRLYITKNIKLILDYKSACLFHNDEIAKKLKPEFDEISDYYRNGIGVISNIKTKIRTIETSEEEKTNLINERVTQYLNASGKKEESKAIFPSQYMKQYGKYLDNEKYVDYKIKRNDVEKVSIKEIYQIIEVLKYFIANLKSSIDVLERYQMKIKVLCDEVRILDEKIRRRENNIRLSKEYTKLTNNGLADEDCMKFILPESKLKRQSKELKELSEEKEQLIKKIEETEKEVENVVVDDNEKLNNKAFFYNHVLATYKIRVVNKNIVAYSKVLNYLNNFLEIYENDKNLSKVISLSSSVDEKFIMDTIKNLRKSINCYKRLKLSSKSDESNEEIKALYLSKVYED